MSDPILNLSTESNWALIYNETTAAGRIGSGAYSPIAAFTIPVLLSSPIVVVEAQNLDARPWWYLGCRLQQVVTVGIAPDQAIGSLLRVPVNRPSLLRFPRWAADYALKCEIPPWFDRMKISIFEYVGQIGDSTEQTVNEQADLIRIDLSRIESKIDQL